MNPLKDQNYLAIDLELNSKQDGTTPRIIEVGIAIGSPVRPDEIVSVNWYLNPDEPITPFITKLTGIDDATIQSYSVKHEVVAKELGALIKSYNCFTNPVVWGGGGEGNDATELKDEFRERDIDFPFFGRRVVDVKTLYVFKQLTKGKNPNGGLKSALGSNKMKFKGTPHRAADDAYNTLLLFFYYLKNENTIQNMAQEILKS